MNKTLFALAADFGNLNHAEILKAVFNQAPQAFLSAVEATPKFEVEATPAWVTEVINLVRTPGSKIEAVKALRTATGLGLKEAKDVVDTMMGTTSQYTKSDQETLNKFTKAGFVVPIHQVPTVPQVPSWYGSLLSNLNGGFFDDAAETIRRNNPLITAGDANDLIDLLRGKIVGASPNTYDLFNAIYRAGFKPTKNLWEPCPDWMKSFVEYLEKGESSKARQLMMDCCYDMFVCDCDEVIDALNRQSYESSNSRARSMLDKFKEGGLAVTCDWKLVVIGYLNNGNEDAAFDHMKTCGVSPFLGAFERMNLFKVLRGYMFVNDCSHDTQTVYQQFVDEGLSVKLVTSETSWYQEVVDCINSGNFASASDIVDTNTELCKGSCDDIVEALRCRTSPHMTDKAKSVFAAFTEGGWLGRVTG